MPLCMDETYVCVKVVWALSGEALNIWIHGSSCIRQLKMFVRDALNKHCPLWHIHLTCENAVCAEMNSISDYDLREGFHVLVLTPSYDETDAFYEGDLAFTGNVVTLGFGFTQLWEQRKQDLLETIASDARITAIVGR